MCGIFLYKGQKQDWDSLEPDINRIGYRGPDNTHHEVYIRPRKLSQTCTHEASSEPPYQSHKS